MSNDTSALKRELADLSASAVNAERSADEIHRAAQDRRDVVARRLGELRPTALTDDQASDEYLSLTHEKGTLDRILRDADD